MARGPLKLLPRQSANKPKIVRRIAGPKLADVPDLGCYIVSVLYTVKAITFAECKHDVRYTYPEAAVKACTTTMMLVRDTKQAAIDYTLATILNTHFHDKVEVLGTEVLEYNQGLADLFEQLKAEAYKDAGYEYP